MTQHDARIPKDVVREVLRRSCNRCEECGRVPVEIHHLTYGYWYNHDVISNRGKETPEELMVLCRECHLARHVVVSPLGTEFFSDPEDAESERSYWDHVTDKLYDDS